jgi:hypothetical protein
LNWYRGATHPRWKEAMSPALARPLLHTVHLLTFAVLFATGLLLFVPGLRAVVTGGYSLLIRETHRWGGVAFAALPTLIVLRGGVRSVFPSPPRRTLRTLWQGMHVVITLVMSAVFIVTGFVMWGRRALPESVVDASQSMHDWLTYAAAVLVVAHLLEVGMAAVVAQLKAGVTSTAQHSKT